VASGEIKPVERMTAGSSLFFSPQEIAIESSKFGNRIEMKRSAPNYLDYLDYLDWLNWLNYHDYLDYPDRPEYR